MHMGIQPYLIASAARAFIAQRLVRRICTECKVEVTDSSKSPLPKEVLPVFYEGKGCETCRFTGFQGRIAIYEILQLSEPLRELILQKTSSDVIKKEAVKLGMRTLYHDGLKKVALGLTTPGEVLLVTQSEL